MTTRQQTVRDYLCSHCPGRDHGKPYHELLWAVRFTHPSCYTISVRGLRQAIHDLVLNGAPIGSSRDYGIFWCLDEADYTTALATLADEAYPTMRRLEALKGTIRRNAQTWMI